MSRHQIWQAFVQESICTIAASADMEISLGDNLAIDEITEEAQSAKGSVPHIVTFFLDTRGL